MNKRKLWTLIAVPGLAVTSLLLAFLLLGWNTVGAASDGPAAITDIQSLDTGFIISGTMFAPDGAASGSSLDACGNVWIIETVDSAGDVGSNSSLTLAPTYPYTPYISYRNLATDQKYLKYAWLSGTTWLSETIDTGGDRTSLALVPTYPYTPFIVHHRYWGGWKLKYACQDGTTWITKTLAGNDTANGSLALVPTPPYTPHVSYYNLLFGAKTLDYAYLSGTTWCSGTWLYETVEPGGGRNSLALESKKPYTTRISYGANGNLKHAWKDGTTWFSETVDSTVDVGDFSALALDSNNNPHIAYYDATSVTVKYARLSDTIWLSETVDSVAWVDANTPNPAWRPISLDLNQANVPYISYYDADNGDVKLAYLSGTVWITQTVASAGKDDQFISLALDQAGCPHISYYDPTNDDLKYARPPVAVTADFIASPRTGVAPLTVVFTNLSTGDYASSEWDFGDGRTSTSASPTYTYTSTGVYTVTLTVSGLGGTDTATKTEYIKVDNGFYLPIIMKN